MIKKYIGLLFKGLFFKWVSEKSKTTYMRAEKWGFGLGCVKHHNFSKLKSDWFLDTFSKNMKLIARSNMDIFPLEASSSLSCRPLGIPCIFICS